MGLHVAWAGGKPKNEEESSYRTCAVQKAREGDIMPCGR